MCPLLRPPLSFLHHILSTIENKFLSLKQLQQIHGQILTHGNLVSTPFLTTFLSSCYFSHNPRYALHFLQNLSTSIAKATLWNSMIKASLQSDNLIDFFTFYNGMMRCSSNVSPTPWMFALVIRWCVKNSNIQQGKLFHCLTAKWGFDYHVVMQTGLLELYAKVGDLRCARRAFDEMSHRDVFAHNVMISAFGKHGFVEDARVLFDSMPEKDSFTWNSMISCYCKVCDVVSALAIFDMNPVKDNVSWNTMINGYCQSRYLSTADNLGDFVNFYNGMRHSNVCPSQSSLTLILWCCAGITATQLGKSFHCQIFKWNFTCDVVLQTGLLDFYAKVGDLSYAKRVFDEMLHKDVVANNAMISALSKHGFVKDAQNLFDSMPEKNSFSWNSMITCYCKLGDIDLARSIFDHHPVKDVVSWNAMIDGYCKLGHLNYAEELFDRIGATKNSVTWNTMITGFVQCREFGRALHFFQQMQAKRVKPTEVTMVSLLSACAHLGALDMGEWIYGYVKLNKLKMDVFLGNAIIDMYCKCGSIEAALDVFHALQVKNIYCWNSVIIGLAMHGYGYEAIDYFISMEKEGINPDGVTFVSLLCACTHSGLISAGRMYFSQMQRIYGVEPRIEHFGCMVDLLGRSGLLVEALELIKTMPMEPNAAVWGSLLLACHIHKDTELGERVTQHLLEWDSCNGGNYVFLSNLYASLNRWKDVDDCRKLMVERGVHKTPGCSSIEVGNVMHEFVAGDSSHPQFHDIDVFLVDLAKELRDCGYERDAASSFQEWVLFT